MNIKNNKWSLLGSFSLGLLLSACGGGGGGTPEPPPPPPPPLVVKADVNSTFSSIPQWETYSPIQTSKDEPDPNVPVTEPEEELVGTLKYQCTSTQYNLVDTPKEIVVFSPNASVMWLGNLIQGEGYKQGLGSFTELSVRERAPLKISIDLLTAENFKIVDDPSLTTVQSAIGELVQQATDSGLVNSSDATYSEEFTHSVKQSALKFGISANYMGASATTDLEYSKNAEETTLTAYFYQKMFTASVELPPTPDDFFSNDFTQQKLDALVVDGSLGDDNPPVYIANVVYGRILMYNFTSTAEESLIRAAITASYDGVGSAASGSAYTETEIQNTLNSAKVKVTALGGQSSNITSLIRDGNLKSYFNDDPALTSASPISYQLNQLKVGNPIAKVTETTDYTVRECTFIEDTAEPIGERIRVELIDIDIKYDCDGAGFGAGEMYGNFSIEDIEVFNVPSRNDIQVSSGNALALDAQWDFDVFYSGDRNALIKGRIQEKDNGADDNVGTWNFTINVINNKGRRSSRGSNQCGNSSQQPVLNYKISRLNYIF